MKRLPAVSPYVAVQWCMRAWIVLGWLLIVPTALLKVLT